MKKLILITLIITSFLGCKKDVPVSNSGNADYFVVGMQPGFVAYDPMKYFQLKNGQIYPADKYVNGDYIFKTTPLSSNKYTIAKPAMDNLPQYLKDNPNKSFTCPNCADEPLFYIEIRQNGVKTYWIIDTLIYTLPAVLQSYAQQLSDILSQL